ncbi:endoribonuclease Arlr-like [Hetaerina americana]|uniref:endoribonuclease Arlr-like n=1 Tax=Hetaerina americana TaxID=62018 RepID=UPI003A7F2715
MEAERTSLRWILTATVFLAVISHWSDAATNIASTTDEELSTLTENLLRHDIHNAAKYVTINIQGRAPSGTREDRAPNPLLTVDSRAYQILSISKLKLLYNNYVADTGVTEHVTAGERAEENNLLDAVVVTPVMTRTHRFLADKGYVRRDQKSFKDMMRELWFGMYSRGGGKLGSSAMEHVFLGELKKGEISGLHNWIFFNNEEIQNHMDYLGYVRKVDLGGKGYILKLPLKWSHTYKPVGTMFIGTSPELEMALYTICFFTRPNTRCPISLGDQRVFIKTFTFRFRGKNYIGSAYPDI